MLDEKDFQKLDELISRRIGIVMENDVMPKFDLLADGIAGIQEKLVPRSRVDDLEDDVRFLKAWYIKWRRKSAV